MTCLHRISHFVFCFIAGLFAASCVVVPIPTKQRIQSPTAVKGKPVDVSYIKPGATTRQEVLDKLAWADAGLDRERLFLARWGSSHLIVLWAVGGGYSAAGGAPTIWNRRNLLVEFDAKGVVETFRPVRDEDLPQELSTWLTQVQEPPLDLSKPVTIMVMVVQAYPLELTLGQDFFGVRDVRIAPREITGIKCHSADDPAYVWLEILFAKGSAAGKNLSFHMRTWDLLTFLKYLQQTNVKVAAGN
jgi:hypothetical protein